MPPSAAADPTPLVPAVRKPPAEAIRQLERVVLEGNLAQLTDGERVAYYARVCESLGLNPLTRPFEYITLNNKLTLYVRKDATDQLRDLHGVSIERIERERDEDLALAIVTAHARDRYGRIDSSIGAVSIKGLSGENMANALMKAETKAKRRATLSICGLGWMDEIEAMDQRAVEVAPRQAVASAIRSRTAALTGGNESGESEVGGAIVTDGAEPEGVGIASSGGSPAICTHARTRAGDLGVYCKDCGELLAARPEEPKARSRAKREAPALKPGDEGYGNARAHAVANERGLDHAAVHRIAADVLGIEEADLAAFSVKDLTEADWEQVIAAIAEAPKLGENEGDNDAIAEVWAGTCAARAGLAESAEDPWAAVGDFMGSNPADLSPGELIEFGIRATARNPLP